MASERALARTSEQVADGGVDLRAGEQRLPGDQGHRADEPENQDHRHELDQGEALRAPAVIRVAHGP
jgi:hypothetical protein